MKSNPSSYTKGLDADLVKKLSPVPYLSSRPYVYHLSIDPDLQKLKPFLSKRTGNIEDKSTPRASVAFNLAHCVSGYAAVPFEQANPAKVLKGRPYRGGYYLYRTSYEYVFKPSTELLYDQPHTQEHWLLFNETHPFYNVEKCAKLYFTKNTNFGMVEGDSIVYNDNSVVEFYLQVLCADGLAFSNKSILLKGFYRYHGPNFETAEPQHNKIPSPLVVSEEVFNKKRPKNAAMLNA